MHHIRLRCGWRAFFFERLAHGLVGERVHIGQLDHAPREQAQRPAGASVGRSRTGECDQVGFLGTIKLTLIEARPRAVGSQRRLESFLDKALPNALHGGAAHPHGLGDALIRPPRFAVSLVGLEQDLSAFDLANIGLAAREQPLKLVAFLTRKRHSVFLGHGRPPRHQPLRLTTKTPGSLLQP